MTPPSSSTKTRRSFWMAGFALALAAVGGAWWWDARHEGAVWYVSASGGSKAINRAIAKCAEHGGEVRLRSGTYVCTEPIIIRNNNISLSGSGAATLLILADKADCPVLIVGDEAEKPRWDVSHVRVSHLAIDGNRANQQKECWSGSCDTGGKSVIRSSGIVLRRATDVQVEQVSIRSCRSGGLVTEKGCRRLTVRQLDASDHEFDGLACYETTESLFTELYLHDNKAAGISTDTHFNENLVTNTFLSRNGTHGIFMRNSHDNAFQTLMISDSGRDGIFLDQADKESSTAASGNSFIGLHIAGSGRAAIRINSPECKHTLIAGCQFSDNESGLSEATPGMAKFQAALTQ